MPRIQYIIEARLGEIFNWLPPQSMLHPNGILVVYWEVEFIVPGMTLKGLTSRPAISRS